MADNLAANIKRKYLATARTGEPPMEKGAKRVLVPPSVVDGGVSRVVVEGSEGFTEDWIPGSGWTRRKTPFGSVVTAPAAGPETLAKLGVIDDGLPSEPID
jgi:hypothetical protein